MVFERLNELNDRYTELEQRMEQPEVYTDAEAYSRCARELKRRLGVGNLLSDSEKNGRIVFRSSVDTEEELQLYQWMFEQPIEA